MPVDIESGNLPKPVVSTEHQFFRVRFVVNVDFPEGKATLAQELLYAPAVAAPGSGINCDFSHQPYLCTLLIRCRKTCDDSMCASSYLH